MTSSKRIGIRSRSTPIHQTFIQTFKQNSISGQPKRDHPARSHGEHFILGQSFTVRERTETSAQRKGRGQSHAVNFQRINILDNSARNVTQRLASPFLAPCSLHGTQWSVSTDRPTSVVSRARRTFSTQEQIGTSIPSYMLDPTNFFHKNRFCATHHRTGALASLVFSSPSDISSKVGSQENVLGKRRSVATARSISCGNTTNFWSENGPVQARARSKGKRTQGYSVDVLEATRAVRVSSHSERRHYHSGAPQVPATSRVAESGMCLTNSDRGSYTIVREASMSRRRCYTARGSSVANILWNATGNVEEEYRRKGVRSVQRVNPIMTKEIAEYNRAKSIDAARAQSIDESNSRWIPQQKSQGLRIKVNMGRSQLGIASLAPP